MQPRMVLLLHLCKPQSSALTCPPVAGLVPALRVCPAAEEAPQAPASGRGASGGASCGRGVGARVVSPGAAPAASAPTHSSSRASSRRAGRRRGAAAARHAASGPRPVCPLCVGGVTRRGGTPSGTRAASCAASWRPALRAARPPAAAVVHAAGLGAGHGTTGRAARPCRGAGCSRRAAAAVALGGRRRGRRAPGVAAAGRRAACRPEAASLSLGGLRGCQRGRPGAAVAIWAWGARPATALATHGQPAAVTGAAAGAGSAAAADGRDGRTRHASAAVGAAAARRHGRSAPGASAAACRHAAGLVPWRSAPQHAPAKHAPATTAAAAATTVRHGPTTAAAAAVWHGPASAAPAAAAAALWSAAGWAWRLPARPWRPHGPRPRNGRLSRRPPAAASALPAAALPRRACRWLPPAAAIHAAAAGRHAATTAAGHAAAPAAGLPRRPSWRANGLRRWRPRQGPWRPWGLVRRAAGARGRPLRRRGARQGPRPWTLLKQTAFSLSCYGMQYTTICKSRVNDRGRCKTTGKAEDRCSVHHAMWPLQGSGASPLRHPLNACSPS